MSDEKCAETVSRAAKENLKYLYAPEVLEELTILTSQAIEDIGLSLEVMSLPVSGTETNIELENEYYVVVDGEKMPYPVYLQKYATLEEAMKEAIPLIGGFMNAFWPTFDFDKIVVKEDDAGTMVIFSVSEDDLAAESS